MTAGEKFFRVIEPPSPPLLRFETAAIEDRLPAFDAGPADARTKLAAASVAVVGVGSVGRVAAEHLARVGVGTLQLIDRAALKPQSLLTHASTRPCDIGQSKAVNAGAFCKSLRPETNVLVLDAAIENLAPAALVDTDIAVLASDNLAAEVCVGQLCAWLGKPLVHVSVHGETLVAQARTFSNQGENPPCPRCAFGSAEEEHLRAGQHFPCDGGAAPTAPTMSTAALCSLAGSLGATLALRHLLNLGQPLGDRIHEWCGYTMQTWAGPIRRRGDCPTEHCAWEIVRTCRPLREMSLREVVRACGVAWPSTLALEVDAFVIADPGGASFAFDDGSIPRVFSRRSPSAAQLQGIADQPLAKITPGLPRWVKVSADSRTYLLADAADVEAANAR